MCTGQIRGVIIEGRVFSYVLLSLSNLITSISDFIYLLSVLSNITSVIDHL